MPDLKNEISGSYKSTFTELCDPNKRYKKTVRRNIFGTKNAKKRKTLKIALKLSRFPEMLERDNFEREGFYRELFFQIFLKTLQVPIDICMQN